MIRWRCTCTCISCRLRTSVHGRNDFALHVIEHNRIGLVPYIILQISSPQYA
eukprot:jgi/Botrbrau1/18073/Bobra.0062s0059.1